MAQHFEGAGLDGAVTARFDGGLGSGSGSGVLDQRLWHGCVPVVFSLHPSEVTTLHAPRPFYAMVPRMSYLVAQTREVVEYFRDAAPPIGVGGLPGAGIWFEAAGVPLKWHLPFGVLWDLLGGDALLPWQVTVRFQGFPVDELLPCENEKSVETHFMHSLKQSQIWTSVIKNDVHGYREAARDLLQSEDPSSLRFVPIRVHFNRAPAVQMPITPLTNDHREKTLHDVLSYLLPDVFPSHECAVVVHGIPVPPEVSLLSLYRNFAYADGFLYVSIVARES
ncbi:hypothetical protein PybrP1_001350 [[Pythium] brassicae (nom. inval.)]|nr:hypothetical protein PybrP1_001350 [[Pythium] brassicae (nom. inval.)]